MDTLCNFVLTNHSNHRESTMESVVDTGIDWEKYAICYDRLLDLKPYTSMLEEVVEHVLQGSCTNILDASCGTGNFEMFLDRQPLKEPINITGVDSSQEMLAQAESKSRMLKNPNLGCQFGYADLNKRLPFQNEVFDCVVSLNTIYAVASPKSTLLEFRRVLKPNGKLYVVVPKPDYENGLILRDHVGDNSSVEEWLDAHASPEREEKLIRRTFVDESAIEDMLVVARHNRFIANNNEFHFFDSHTFKELLDAVTLQLSGMSFTYAKQDLFVRATKGS